MNKRYKKKGGFADTTKYPHKNHPAKYNRINNDIIEYVTFTHHDKVKINGQVFTTIPLTSNIDKEERKNTKNKSYVFPKVFIGKRSSLGKENNNYNLTYEDKKIVKDLFVSLPRENVPYSKNNNRNKRK